jgi:hypothetical protein
MSQNVKISREGKVFLRENVSSILPGLPVKLLGAQGVFESSSCPNYTHN